MNSVSGSAPMQIVNTLGSLIVLGPGFLLGSGVGLGSLVAVGKGIVLVGISVTLIFSGEGNAVTPWDPHPAIKKKEISTMVETKYLF